jgi:hypothetical protein
MTAELRYHIRTRKLLALNSYLKFRFGVERRRRRIQVRRPSRADCGPGRIRDAERPFRAANDAHRRLAAIIDP